MVKWARKHRRQCGINNTTIMIPVSCPVRLPPRTQSKVMMMTTTWRPHIWHLSGSKVFQIRICMPWMSSLSPQGGMCNLQLMIAVIEKYFRGVWHFLAGRRYCFCKKFLGCKMISNWLPAGILLSCRYISGIWIVVKPTFVSNLKFVLLYNITYIQTAHCAVIYILWFIFYFLQTASVSVKLCFPRLLKKEHIFHPRSLTLLLQLLYSGLQSHR